MTTKEFKIQLALGSLSNKELREIARNSKTSKGILRILSKGKDWNIKLLVAGNLNTPIEILIYLSKDKSDTVQWYVRHNPNTPKEIIKKLRRKALNKLVGCTYY